MSINKYDKIYQSGILFVILSSLFIISTALPGWCVDISDDPMDTKVEAAPPNIMFILDNSGSMDWEFMTENVDGNADGKFNISGTQHEYLFNDPGDNNYPSGDLNGTILSSSDRAHWKSQWSEYNKLYYNPHSIYTPWPSTDTYTMDNADLTEPVSNPIHSGGSDPSITLKDIFFTLGIGDVESIIVDNLDTDAGGFGAPTGGFSTSIGSTWNESVYEYEWSGSSVYTSTDGGQAKFTPNIITAGKYLLYAWWNCYTDRDSHAEIVINHNGATDTVYKQQNSSAVTNNESGICGDWVLIGIYDFQAGTTDNVIIERNIADGSTGGSTIADAIKLVPSVIRNAHYYSWYDENGDEVIDNLEVYLVTWEDNDNDGTLDKRIYYQVNSADDIIDDGELIPLAYDEDDQANDEVPNDIQPKNYEEDGVNYTYKTDEEDLQNFANWYSYYRRRELTAKAAIAKSIKDLDWVYAGFYTINSGVRQTVLPINVQVTSSTNIIVDNQDSGFTTSGTWNESGAQSYGTEYNNSSLYSYTGTAKWTPYLATAGTYKVYAYWGYAGSRTTTAQYAISHAGGISYVTKNHNILADAFKWQLLGEYSFNAGSTGYVTVHNIGSSSYVASADAIKFELTSGGGASVTVDDTNLLLDSLYSINSDGSTYLRSALQNVGRYYDQDDGYTGNLGTSPFQSEADGGACQQAFTILMTDGYYNGSSPGVGNVDQGAGAPYEDSYSDTLADVAMKYYDTDLSDSLPDNLPTNTYDDKKTQHMVTYSISFGVSGTIDMTDIDGDSVADDPSYEDDPYFLNSNTPKPTWPNPGLGESQKIDDLWHAAVNGRGEFFNADDPDELVSSLNSVFENLTSRIASGASVSVNGDELNTGSVMYQSTYTSGDWLGDVTAYPIDAYTGEIKTEESDVLWHARDVLQNKFINDSDYWDTGRRIVTYNGYNSIINFRYASLTDLQKTSIGSSSDVVDYIRGREVTGFRYRQKKLGDIVHSAPYLVVGDGIDNDSDGLVDEIGYGYDEIDNDSDGQTDESDEKNLDEHRGVIFAGGNDGMLHAFDAASGEEIFGYVPHILFDHLSDLTSVSYAHQFYVDATPFSRIITIDSDKKVLLTGGLKKGGKGYYCLDISKILYQNTTPLTEDYISTPAHVDGIDVLWEYPKVSAGADSTYGTADDAFGTDDDLGYSYSDIFIAQSYYTTGVNPTDHNWMAFFGNGYDSVNGSAVLYVLNAYTGEVVKKIDTGVTGDNGLSSPALIDINNDGKVDFVYAGDLKGNMWKFDLTDSNPDNWEIAYTNADTTPAPLFSSPGQPITSAPDVMNHCESSGYMVLFGTGKFIGDSDRNNNDKQTIYGIWDTRTQLDNGTWHDGHKLGVWNEAAGTLSEITNATLLEQTEISFVRQGDTNTLTGGVFENDLRVLSSNTPGVTPSTDWVGIDTSNGSLNVSSSNNLMGWYFDLPMDRDSNSVLDGERVIKDVLIRDKNLIVITFTPNDSPCTGGGYSMVHEMDACDGSRLDTPQFDINMDGVIDSNDLIEIDDPNNPGQKILVPPTGKGYDGLLHPPIIVTMPDRAVEMKIFSSSAGTTERLFEKAEGGFYYWREIKN